jgi:hypothetical protein
MANYVNLTKSLFNPYNPRVVNEGQFSWFTQDTGRQIGSERSNTIDVWMFDNQGNSWYEKEYAGYGEFGGMDYYELLAKMNGYSEEDLEGYKGTFKEMRQLGIDLAFGKLKTKAKGNKVLFPALVASPKFNWKRHDFTQEAESDPNQSWSESIQHAGAHSSINEWGSSDQSIMNKAIHNDAGKPKQMPSPFDKKLRDAAESAVDFYWDDWEEYEDDRDALIDDAVRGYLRQYFKKDFEMMQRMFEPMESVQVTEAKKYTVKDIASAWEDAFGEDIMDTDRADIPYDVEVDYKGKVTIKDLEEIYDNRYGEKLEPEFLEALGESVVTESISKQERKEMEDYIISMEDEIPGSLHSAISDEIEHNDWSKGIKKLNDDQVQSIYNDMIDANESVVTEARDWGTFGEFGDDKKAISTVTKTLDKALAKFEAALTKAHADYQKAIKEFTTGSKADMGRSSGFHDTEGPGAVHHYTKQAIKKAFNMEEWGGGLDYKVGWMFEGLTWNSLKESLGLNERSINKIQKEYSQVVMDMSKTVEEWKVAEGDRKAELLAKLKDLTNTKHKLHKELDAAVAGKDKDLQLVIGESNEEIK